MPWRKYESKRGKHGPIYKVARGVSVRQTADGKWIIFIEKGGERKNITIDKGRDALVKAIKAAEQIAKGMNGLLNRPKETADDIQYPLFSEYSKEWYEDNSAAKNNWADATMERYEGALRIYIRPSLTFKGKRVNEISKKEIRRFLKKLRKKMSPASVGLVHSVISGIFTELVEDEVLQANPAAGLLKKVLGKKKKRNLTDPEPFKVKERDKFLACAERILSWRLSLILKVMAFAGLRLGEALAFRFRDIDFENKTYDVKRSFSRQRFSTPKEDKTRLVNLPTFLVEELQAYIRHLKKEGLNNGRGAKVDLLFLDPKEKGMPYSQRKIQDAVAKVCKIAELDRRHPHDLRHTYATILLMAHVSPAYVQKQLGHHSISLTVDTYCKWIPGGGRDGLEEAFGGNVVRNPGEIRIFPHMEKRKARN